MMCIMTSFFIKLDLFFYDFLMLFMLIVHASTFIHSCQIYAIFSFTHFRNLHIYIYIYFQNLQIFICIILHYFIYKLYFFYFFFFFLLVLFYILYTLRSLHVICHCF